MSLDPDDESAAPKIHVTVRVDGTGEVAIDDALFPVAEPTLQDARRTATELVVAQGSQKSGGPVQVQISDPDGPCTLIVHPDGTVNVRQDPAPPAEASPVAAPRAVDEAPFWPPGAVEEGSWWPAGQTPPAAVEPPGASTPAPLADAPAVPPPLDPPPPAVDPRYGDTPPRRARSQAAPVTSPSPPPTTVSPPPADVSTRPSDGSPSVADSPPSSDGSPSVADSPPSGDGSPPMETPLAPGRHARRSFIATEAPVEPAQVGVRGSLARMGIRTGPSRKEQALRDDVRLVSQHWAGPRTVAVANPKGSANKTPTTVCLSAIFARYGGGPVLAWDNNETRGTAAWRTGKGPHDATVLDLLPRTQELLAVGAQAAELARYVHHQPADKFDVLWSDQSTEGEHEVTGEEVDAIHEVAAKYYRLVFMDSGNSERASNWRAMIRHGHSLVVPCTNVEDTAEAGARMLEALAQRDDHSAELARNAVAVISQRTPGNDPHMRRIVNDFAPLVRTVVTIPHDPALYSGVIRFDALRPATQRAWLAAGAAVAAGL
jgi:MinD-like ATPase involved in chromosome partitioning or flagellar assembly